MLYATTSMCRQDGLNRAGLAAGASSKLLPSGSEVTVHDHVGHVLGHKARHCLWPRYMLQEPRLHVSATFLQKSLPENQRRPSSTEQQTHQDSHMHHVCRSTVSPEPNVARDTSLSQMQLGISA